MFTEKFMDVLNYDGVVAIGSCKNNEVHVVNTWNKYLELVDDRLLIPAAGMRKTEKNITENPKVEVTLGSHEVMGYKSMGTGFLIKGTAEFIVSGAEYDMMKEKYPFLSRVLAVKVESCVQTI